MLLGPVALLVALTPLADAADPPGEDGGLAFDVDPVVGEPPRGAAARVDRALEQDTAANRRDLDSEAFGDSGDGVVRGSRPRHAGDEECDATV
jgi:hypothetical protein